MKSESKSEVELTKKGVFHQNKKIADPIRVRARGKREPDGKWFAQIRFRTMDGDYRSELFPMSCLLPDNRKELKCRLADFGYRWPEDAGLSQEILGKISTAQPTKTFQIVNGPGWRYPHFVLPGKVISPDATPPEIFIDPETAHIGEFAVGEGALADWQEHIAKPSRLSRCLRLAISAAFAAPFLRLLEMDSFGLNFFSETSDGKTLALYVGASVPGLIGPAGLPGWADSIAGLEDLLIGRRDCLVPVDEQGDGEHQMPPEEKARSLAFMVARNRPRRLARRYERNHNLEGRESRNIVISTSERSMGQIAREAKSKRLGGEEVRLIDVPASDPGSSGIFDRDIDAVPNQTLQETTKDLVDRLRVDSIKYQGHAFRAFLDRCVHHADGLALIKRYKELFEKDAAVPAVHNAHYRIRGNFAVIYGAAALAIDYKILPWKRKPTFQAIEKCMRLALDRIDIGRARATSATPSLDSDRICRTLHERITEAKIVKVTPKQRTTDKQVRQRRHADGFKINGKLYVKPNCFKQWFPKQAERYLLKDLKLIITERNDTATVEKKIGGIDGKPRYYAIDIHALRRLIPARN